MAEINPGITLPVPQYRLGKSPEDLKLASIAGLGVLALSAAYGTYIHNLSQQHELAKSYPSTAFVETMQAAPVETVVFGAVLIATGIAHYFARSRNKGGHGVHDQSSPTLVEEPRRLAVSSKPAARLNTMLNSLVRPGHVTTRRSLISKR